MADPVVVDVEGKDKPEEKVYEVSTGLTHAEAAIRLKHYGPNELQEKKESKIIIYLKQLKGPMPIMIWIAIIVEAAIQKWVDMAILLGIQFANATIAWYEYCKAGDAVAALKASLKPEATVKRDGKWEKTNASVLVPGDLVLLGAGGNVPADCMVNDGTVDIDQAQMTGESLPVSMFKGDVAKMGSTVARGEVEATVVETGMQTFFGKTASMLQGQDSLGNLQRILLTIMGVLVVASLLLCGTAFVYLLVEGISFKEVLEFIIVLLVASIPIAIEIVCTSTLALGSRQLSSHGAIVTRLASIEELAGMNMLCSDKTGTLTLNKMVIQEECPVYEPGETKESIIQMAALAAKWKEPPRDALDTLVLTVANLPACDAYEQLDYTPFDPTLKRTEATLKGPDGRVFKVTKGAPNIICNLLHNKPDVAPRVDFQVSQVFGPRGVRCLAVARSDEQGRWCMLGLLTFLDPPRPDTKETIERALAYGVDVKMITGDHAVIARETSRVLGLGTNIQGSEGLPSLDKDGKPPKDLGARFGQQFLEADGFAGVFPEHKFLIVEAFRQSGFAVGMTGDGVNDAPALKKADVGIAVSGATDAARSAADIVLTHEGLSTIVEAITIARCIFQRIKSFITYRVAATLQLLTFFFIAVFAFPPDNYNITNAGPAALREAEFFKLPVLMLVLITLLNDGTLISIAYDNVKPSPRPEKWNLKVLFLVSTILGAVACGSSLLLLWGALDSCNPNGSMFSAFGLPCMEYSKIVTLIYLKVSLSDFLTLFSARCTGPFWSSRPSIVLIAAAGLSLAISTVLACIWPDGSTDGVPVAGLTRGGYGLWPVWCWLYCLVFFLIQDACKTIANHLIIKFDVFKARTGSLVNMRATQRFVDKDLPLARASAAMVETKLAGMQVEQTAALVNKLEKFSKHPGLERASQTLAKSSVNLAKTSLTGSASDVATHRAHLAEAAANLREMNTDARNPEIEAQIAKMEATVAKLGKVSAAMAAEEEITGIPPPLHK